MSVTFAERARAETVSPAPRAARDSASSPTTQIPWQTASPARGDDVRDDYFRGGGRPLDAGVAASVAPAFGAELGPVRIHDDSATHATARSLGARAYTVGRDVGFAAGEYRPDAPDGRALLAHELAHTVQQSHAAPPAATEAAAEEEARRGDPRSGVEPGVQRAVTWAPPVRADETAAGFDARTFEVPISGSPQSAPFDRFSVYVPANASPEVNNVHVFFAANPVVGTAGNDVMIHGLRATAEASDKWILIGVPGWDAPPAPGYQTISTAQIEDCLKAAGRKTTKIASLRLTAHSRGHRGLEKTLTKGLIDVGLVQRVYVLDAFYQDTKKALGVLKPGQVFQYDLVDALGTKPGQRSQIPGDTRILLSKESDHLAAIGYVRLLQDLRATRPTVASLIAANPAVETQVNSITLPARGRFVFHGGATTPQVDVTAFIAANKAALDAILKVDADPAAGGLRHFISVNNLLGFGGTALIDRYIMAHHLFVAEAAHELFDV